MDKKDVLVIVGSESDRSQIQYGLDLLDEKKISYDFKIFSAHRNLKALIEFLDENENNYSVVITGAGLSAALPGVVASLVKKPVIGIPLVSGDLSGVDALLSMLQLPKDVPCATMGIGKQGVLNAVHLTERILNLR